VLVTVVRVQKANHNQMVVYIPKGSNIAPGDTVIVGKYDAVGECKEAIRTYKEVHGDDND